MNLVFLAYLYTHPTADGAQVGGAAFSLPHAQYAGFQPLPKEWSLPRPLGGLSKPELEKIRRQRAQMATQIGIIVAHQLMSVLNRENPEFRKFQYWAQPELGIQPAPGAPTTQYHNPKNQRFEFTPFKNAPIEDDYLCRTPADFERFSRMPAEKPRLILNQDPELQQELGRQLAEAFIALVEMRDPDERGYPKYPKRMVGE